MAEDSSMALTGAAFDLAHAGYTPMPDPVKKPDKDAIGSDSSSLRQAADRRSGPRDEAVVREYTDANGKRAASNEAISLDRASRDYARAVAADKAAMQDETWAEADQHVAASDDEAKVVNPDMVGRSNPRDANAAEPIADRVQQKATSECGESDAARLEPELAKALEHPQVRLAIEEKIGEAERSRQSYVDGLTAATQIAQASFISQFPELADIAPEHLPRALEQLSRQDPAKFARVQQLVATTEHLAVQQQQESRRQTEAAQRNFQHYAKSEDARLETMLKGEPPELQRAVSAEIMASARESGIEEAELFRLFNSDPLMRNAAFQHMMYDAGKYRMMMKAKDALAARPMPPVQRPGAARTSAEREGADLRSLSAKLSNSGDIKDAVALYHARKANRR